jgi:hypothetical protein
MSQNYIDFLNLPTLIDGEYITNFKLEFDTVPELFHAEDTPFIFCRALPTIRPPDIWVNTTELTADYTSRNMNTVFLRDSAEWKTHTYYARLQVKKLPKTGTKK